MTLGHAAGRLLEAYLDSIPLIGQERREVLAALPAECRFMTPEGTLAHLTMVQAVIDYIDPPLGE